MTNQTAAGLTCQSLSRTCLKPDLKRSHQAATKPTPPILPHLFCTLQQEHTLSARQHTRALVLDILAARPAQKQLSLLSLPALCHNGTPIVTQDCCSVASTARRSYKCCCWEPRDASSSKIRRPPENLSSSPQTASYTQHPSPAVTCRRPSFCLLKHATRPSTRAGGASCGPFSRPGSTRLPRPGRRVPFGW